MQSLFVLRALFLFWEQNNAGFVSGLYASAGLALRLPGEHEEVGRGEVGRSALELRNNVLMTFF